MIENSVKNLEMPLVKSTLVKPIVIIGCLFCVFGFVTWLNSVLIPYLKIACELNNFESYLVAFAFYISYALMAIPSSWILVKVGYKQGIAIGLLVMSAGALVFIPAAMSRTYGLFLTGLFIQGGGLALLQTAANPYVTLLGPVESAAKRISLMGICNVLSGVVSTLLLGAIVLDDADGFKQRLATMSLDEKSAALDVLAAKVIIPYIVMSLVLGVAAVAIYFSSLPEVSNAGDKPEEDGAIKKSIFHFPHLWLGVLTLFLYVGVEVLAGDSIINYAVSQGINLSRAKFFTSLTLGFLFVGFVTGSVCIPKYFSQRSALIVAAILGMIFIICSILSTGYVAVLFIAMLGLINAMMWPAIWPLSIADLGRFTKLGASLLVMAIGGGAVVPLLYGHLSDLFNAQQAYWMVIPCYLFILYFAVSGHKIRTKPKNR